MRFESVTRLRKPNGPGGPPVKAPEESDAGAFNFLLTVGNLVSHYDTMPHDAVSAQEKIGAKHDR
jgi:hypothetical protein